MDYVVRAGLLGHEANAALVGGVNIILMAKTTASICQLQALSITGRCRTFDSRSDRIITGGFFRSDYT